MRRPALHLKTLLPLIWPVLLMSTISCSLNKQTRPSILVVAVDRLGVGQVSCASERDDSTQTTVGSGLAEICEEGVRFTHAFTSSTLSAPAMGSILTGLNPHRSGLRHNGAGEQGSLRAAIETVAERALTKGYRTLFVSGAPPLLRRTGLHQGFEVFDDALQPDPRRLHRPARTVVDLFSRWLDNEVGDAPFLAVVHFGDMLVPWKPMPDVSGRIRESTARGQMEEIDESLARLWAYLKKRKRWENTTVVVTGLQGDFGDGRPDEIPALDVHSEMAHIALLVKESGARARGKTAAPPGQPAYNWAPKTWSFDGNVSIADIGKTIFEWVDPQELEKKDEHVDIEDARSLKRALEGPSDDHEEWRKQDRLILTESAWAKWQVDPSLPVRVGMRRGPYLYLHDERPAIYNTLTDAFEVSPLPRRNSVTEELRGEFETLAEHLGFRKFTALSQDLLVKERWARSYFQSRLGSRALPADPNFHLDQQRMETIAKTDAQAAFWLRLKAADQKGLAFEASACSRSVFSNPPASESELASICPFRGAKEIARWTIDREEDARLRLFEVIYRADLQRATAVNVAESSLALGQIWETGLTRRLDFEGLEILMAQPEAQRLKQQIQRRSRAQPEL